jgi:hypothetical protein
VWAQVVAVALSALAVGPAHFGGDECPLVFSVFLDELAQPDVFVRREALTGSLWMGSHEGQMHPTSMMIDEV